jgi:hypothetical protein
MFINKLMLHVNGLLVISVNQYLPGGLLTGGMPTGAVRLSLKVLLVKVGLILDGGIGPP